MNFSKFANLLYLHIGFGKKTSDFTLLLIENIMKEPVLNEDKKLAEEDKYIPYSGNADMLGRIFKGSKSISKENAGRILECLDTERFVSFIEEFADEAIESIEVALQEEGVLVADHQVGATCANLFVSILDDLVHKERKFPRKATPPNQQPQTEQTTIKSTSRVPLYECFASAVAGFPIERFLDSDPADSLPDYLIRDAVTFWGHINAELEREHTLDRTNEPYKSIVTFIDALKDYLGFLMVFSRRPDAFPDDFHFNTGDSEIAHKANSDRADLKNLFNIANAAIKAEREKIDRERADTTHTHAGEYLHLSL